MRTGTGGARASAPESPQVRTTYGKSRMVVRHGSTCSIGWHALLVSRFFGIGQRPPDWKSPAVREELCEPRGRDERTMKHRTNSWISVLEN